MLDKETSVSLKTAPFNQAHLDDKAVYENQKDEQQVIACLSVPKLLNCAQKLLDS